MMRVHLVPERRPAFLDFFPRWREACVQAGAAEVELWQSADDPAEFVELRTFADTAAHERFLKADGRVADLRRDYETLLGDMLDTAVIEHFDSR